MSADTNMAGYTTGATADGGRLRADLEHMVLRDGRRGLVWTLDVIAKTVVMARVRAVVLFRFSQWLARHRMLPLAYWVQSRIIRGAGTEISPLADIGPGLCIMHSVGIVMGPEVRVGRNLRVYQGVTLGDGGTPGQPVVGDDVTIGANALVLGGITIGDRAVIGANAVVTRDVPNDMIATGMPATCRPR